MDIIDLTKCIKDAKWEVLKVPVKIEKQYKSRLRSGIQAGNSQI